MFKQSIFVQGIVFTSLLGVGIAIAGSSWQKDDPSQWTSEDVYKILNNSPWSKSVKVTAANQGNGTQSPGGMGRGGGWGGMGGGGIGGMGGGMGGGGMGRGRGSGYPPAEQPTEVVVQWQSALPVRLAEAKSSGNAVGPEAMKPLDEYEIAVMGLPTARLMSQGSTSGSSDDTDDARIADRLKSMTVLSVGHEQLRPVKVELNQGRDGRTIFHFEKSEPITVQDKDAEFRITGERMEVKKKFALKDMEYQGKLAL